MNSYDNSKLTAMLGDFALYDSEGKPVSKQTLSLFSSLTNEFVRYCQTGSKMISFAQHFSAFTQQKKMNAEQCSLLHYALENIFTYEFADNLTNLSPNVFSAYDASTATGKNALLPGGYFQIFHQFSQNIPINLNQVVREIDYEADGVRVITQNDSY